MHKLLIICLLALTQAHAQASPAPAAAALEQRVTALAEQLRCLVCQNQSIADSHAELAIDLKNQVREQLGQGRSERQVIDYMVQRYGDFVLFRPPLKSSTWLLWFGPFLALSGGLALFAARLLRRRPAPAALTPDDQARAARLLGSRSDGEGAR